MKLNVSQSSGSEAEEVANNLDALMGADLLTEENGLSSDDVVADELVLSNGESQLRLETTSKRLLHEDNSFIKLENQFDQSAMDINEYLQHETYETCSHDHSDNNGKTDECVTKMWFFVKYLLVIDECLAILDPWFDFIITSVSSKHLTFIYLKLLTHSINMMYSHRTHLRIFVLHMTLVDCSALKVYFS